MNRVSAHVFKFPASDIEAWVTRIERFYHPVRGSHITVFRKGEKDTTVDWRALIHCNGAILSLPRLDECTVMVTTDLCKASNVFLNTMPRNIPWYDLKTLIKKPSTEKMKTSVTQASLSVCNMMEARRALCDNPSEIKSIEFENTLRVSMFPALLKSICQELAIESFYFDPSTPNSMLLVFKDRTHALRFVRIEQNQYREVHTVPFFDINDGFYETAPFQWEAQDFEAWKNAGGKASESVLKLHGPFENLFPATLKRKRNTDSTDGIPRRSYVCARAVNSQHLCKNKRYVHCLAILM